uniref:Uncharacterized protein n=1 Tax=Branchiostoma floridae TaxID=7739 RepID=C3XW17_BRAFL|eukprot:XP_002611793.1 hypothetical protein BRAFLDRAFT_99049 [Branchiostoma floridae]
MFTTLGTTGRLGPTTLGNHYRGQDHEHLVTLHDGIQHFTVPETGAYNVVAAGETLKILVGQEGVKDRGDWGLGGWGAGGGGGTFVTRRDNKPLIIAGGGGGGGLGLTTHNSLCDGTVSTTGNKSPGEAGCSGGSNGQGATEWKGNAMGGGGGGLLTDGGSSRRYGGDSCQSGGEGGKAFVNGGVGGRWSCVFGVDGRLVISGDNADGGFGGGGGGYGSFGGGGGGGGYSGGGRGEYRVSNGGGGGGGSFNSGTDTSGKDGANNGPGSSVSGNLLDAIGLFLTGNIKIRSTLSRRRSGRNSDNSDLSTSEVSRGMIPTLVLQKALQLQEADAAIDSSAPQLNVFADVAGQK